MTLTAIKQPVAHRRLRRFGQLVPNELKGPPPAMIIGPPPLVKNAQAFAFASAGAGAAPIPAGTVAGDYCVAVFKYGNTGDPSEPGWNVLVNSMRWEAALPSPFGLAIMGAFFENTNGVNLPLFLMAGGCIGAMTTFSGVNPSTPAKVHAAQQMSLLAGAGEPIAGAGDTLSDNALIIRSVANSIDIAGAQLSVFANGDLTLLADGLSSQGTTNNGGGIQTGLGVKAVAGPFGAWAADILAASDFIGATIALNAKMVPA